MKQLSIEQKLSLFEDDWMERYRYIINLGEKMPHFPDNLKTDQYKVDGCISQVWLKMEMNDNNYLSFIGDSDSAIVKGLVAILRDLLSNRPPDEILDEDIEGFFSRVGLQQHISPNRRNGFFSMVQEIRKAAIVIKNTLHQP